MALFWFICSLLLIIALVIIILPCLKKEKEADIDIGRLNKVVYEKKLEEIKSDLDRDLIDQEQYQIAKSDLQRTLIDDFERDSIKELKLGNKIVPVVLIIFVPLISVLLYMQLSNGLQSLTPEFQQQLQSQQQNGMPSVEEAITSLKSKLKQNPNDIEGWVMLGRSYLITENFDAAVKAYAKANEVSNGADPNILVAYGEAQGFANKQIFSEHSMELFSKALQIDPRHERGLWYAGFASYQLKDYKNSVQFWERLMQRIPEDQPEVRASLRVYLDDAKDLAGIEIDNIPAELQTTQKEISASIQVEVSVDARLREKLRESDTLFIYARAVNGPKMPLALVKLTAGDLPVSVTLDDSVSMITGMTLSSMEAVEVIARISPTGQAIMQTGDLFGSIKPVNTRQSDVVNVIINETAK